MNLYTAIVIFDRSNGSGGCKYHNINNIDKFINFVKTTWKHRQVIAINFYDKKTKKFYQQIKIQ